MANTRNTRNRPLYTWGVVILTIAHKVYLRAEHRLHGPTAILLQKLATLLGPLLYAMQYQWLTILSFIDKQILLTIEKKTETLFPTSAYLFNVIDELVETSEFVPDKFDVVFDRLLAIMYYYVPFLNWSVTQSISILNFLIVRLTDWGVVLHVATEKEIMIDANSHDHANEMTSKEEEYKEEHHKNSEAAIASPSAVKSSVIGNGGSKQLLNKGSFKSVLLMEIKDEGMQKKDQVVQDMETKKVQPTYKEKLEMGTKKEEEEGVVHKSNSNVCKDLKAKEKGYEDPVLELFATAWHTK
ncbi:hypothetical protein FRX31_012238 [Thalictrum thalictroides]|uniref:Uncharacterized protein n=1 Tax=Thalictrum thalictroides TaxID=46969 RepID=A0A7J6WML3_THATH|nr:hypothetical protein FRX31_012238 [Thalictrum thalictroides]